AWYRFSKAARRNRAALLTSALVVSALVLGTVVSTWQAIRATRAERQVAATLKVANSQRLLAEERSRLARQVVDEMYSAFARDVLAGMPQLKDVQRRFLEKALAFYQEFARMREDDPEARLGIATAYRDLGNFQNAIELLKALVAEFPADPKYRGY